MSFRPGHLKYFVTVVEEGQITRAARRLHIAQPALSQAIALLESDLGLKLLEREPRGVALTSVGEAFYAKARAALDAEHEALQTARSLVRENAGTIVFGFVGAPPWLDSPAPMAAFAGTHPSIEVRYRELSFPTNPTSAWLAGVDVAVCHLPPVDSKVWVQPLRVEPRVAMLPVGHRLARQGSPSVDDLLDETFIGMHEETDAAWAGFWSLDDHRGGPPAKLTADRTSNPQEVLAALAAGRAIVAVPAAVGRMMASVLPGVLALPVHDADPCSIVLLGHEDRANPLVAAIAAFARDHPYDEWPETPRAPLPAEQSRAGEPTPAGRPDPRRRGTQPAAS